MQLNIGRHPAGVIEKGVYYFPLANYPDFSSLELKNAVDFIQYENANGRDVEIVCQDNLVINALNFEFRKPTADKNILPPDDFVYHAAPLDTAQKILESGKLLSAVRVYGKSAQQLSDEKQDSLWNDPPDYFEYIMFGWGNEPVGDYVVISDVAVGNRADKEFRKGNHTGIRFYFEYEDLVRHPRRVFDGYHAIKVKDELLLSEYLYACIIPEQYRESILPFVPESLKNRVFFVAQNSLGILEWTERVHNFVLSLSKQDEVISVKIDKFSYHLGAADCFCEMVRAGVKSIALSHPCDTEEERNSFLPEFDRLCKKYGVRYYAEDEALLTDLFSLSLNQGKFNVIFYQDESALQEYLDLKAEKEKAISTGTYAECRENIAHQYGKLLSYTDEGIQRLLDANTEKE